MYSCHVVQINCEMSPPTTSAHRSTLLSGFIPHVIVLHYFRNVTISGRCLPSSSQSLLPQIPSPGDSMSPCHHRVCFASHKCRWIFDGIQRHLSIWTTSEATRQEMDHQQHHLPKVNRIVKWFTRKVSVLSNDFRIPQSQTFVLHPIQIPPPIQETNIISREWYPFPGSPHYYYTWTNTVTFTISHPIPICCTNSVTTYLRVPSCPETRHN